VGVQQSGTHALLAFLNHYFGQADDVKHRQPTSQVYLDLYEGSVQPDLGAAGDPGERHGLLVDPERIHRNLSL